MKNLGPQGIRQDTEIRKFTGKWFIPFEDVHCEVMNFRNDDPASETKLKESADYGKYKEAGGEMAKFRFRRALLRAFKEELMAEIGDLV